MDAENEEDVITPERILLMLLTRVLLTRVALEQRLSLTRLVDWSKQSIRLAFLAKSTYYIIHMYLS